MTRIKILLLSLVFALPVLAFGVNDGTKIKVKYKQYKNDIVILGFYSGKNMYVKDTFDVNARGEVVIEYPEAIDGGLYFLALPSIGYFDLVVAEPEISLETSQPDFIASMKVNKSEENRVLYEYQMFMRASYAEVSKLRERQKANKDNEDSVQVIKEKLEKIDADIKAFKEKLFEEHKDLFATKIIKATEEPRPRKRNEDEEDKEYNDYLYNFYQQHYLDNLDFTDERMLKTPVFEPRIDKFINELSLKQPDSVSASCIRVIDRSMQNRELFKFTLSKLFNKYAKFKFMGDETVVYNIAMRYYIPKVADWIDSAQYAKIYDRVAKMQYNLMGMKSKELIMQDSAGKYHSLHAMKSKYTILVFWDETCGSCRKAMKEIKIYYDKTPRDSVDVYAVNIGRDLPAWKAYVVNHNLNFINVVDPKDFNNYRVNYDVFSNPIIYILDDEKKIVARKIPASSLEDFINMLEGKGNKLNSLQSEEKGEF
jgi:thiol-disulfide isomerase/thioredoxin